MVLLEIFRNASGFSLGSAMAEKISALCVCLCVQ
jgi:hypothetical protein